MDRAAQLRREALCLAAGHRLLDEARAYGRAEIVGSVALDLVVKRDIDIHLLVTSGEVDSVASRLYAWAAGIPGTQEAHIHDYSSKGGLKVGIEGLTGPSGDWTVDVWVTDQFGTTGFAMVKSLNRTVTVPQRKTILALKRYYVESGQYEAGLGALIYEAVVERGVETPADLERLRSGAQKLLETGA